MGDWFEKQTVGSLPGRAARLWGPREALCFKGRRWSFAELSARVDTVARGLLGLGVEPGDTVALWMVNRPEWIDAMFAVMKIGAVLVPVNTRFRTEDMAYIVGQSDAGTLIVNERSGPIDYLAMVREAVPGLAAGDATPDPRFPRLQQVIVLPALAEPSAGASVPEPTPGLVGWDAMLAAGSAVDDAALTDRAERVDPEETAFLWYTSGTTGFPKGVMHSHRVIRNTVDVANRMAITSGDVILMYLPLFHAFGFCEGPLMSMVTGARQVLTETFDPAESLDLLARERATLIHGFDTHFRELMEAHERSPRDVSSVRAGLCPAGMSSSTPIARRARKLFGAMVTGYGMSEVGAGVAMSFLDSTEEQATEASGYPAPGYEFRIVDAETGRDQPDGTPGEILIRGYMVMQGYCGKPADTARAIDAQGWMHSGDMGVIRPDGHLRFMGRYKDMLKIGGENVDPMEVEAYLMGHPAINLAAVVGLPDARLVEVAVAFLRLEPGRALTAAQVVDYCRGKVASFKIPRRVLFVDDFPMTSTGKIQKVQLRERALRELGHSA